jgi:hypothetical protein
VAYSLSATQVDDYLWLVVVLFQKFTNYLLDGVHPQPVATIDEWITAYKFWRKRLIVVGFLAEIKSRYASLRDDATVVCLSPVLVLC